MRSDVSTMTRAELFATSRAFFFGAAIGVAVLLAVQLLSPLPTMAAVIPVFFAGWFVLGGVLGGAYYLVRGLIRPADWHPTTVDWSVLESFSAEQAARTLETLVRKELGAAAAPTVTVEALEPEVPGDDRTDLGRFLDGTQMLVHVWHFTASFEVEGRAVQLHQFVGRGLDSRNPVVTRVVVEAACSADEGRFLFARETDPSLMSRLVPLIRASNLRVTNPGAGFRLHDGVARLDTLPSGEVWGPEIGLREFLDVVVELERRHSSQEVA